MSDLVWEANSIRLTVFPAEPLDLKADFWGSIFASEPDSDESRPREGIRRQVGKWREGLAEIQANPSRFDLVVGPAPAEPSANFPAPATITIGKILEELQKVRLPMRAWLDHLPFQINRLALSGVAMAPASSVEESYAILQRHLRSVSVKPESMRELIFRVNWQRKSNYVDILNNMQTWSAMTFLMQSVNIGTNAAFMIQQQYFAQLQFDINTPGDRQTALEPQTIAPIFDELVELVEEAVRQGECPPSAA